MPPFLELVERTFGTKDLYVALGVDKSADETEVRKAYYRLSLKVHPDRVEKEEVEEATIKFQVLGQIYGILSNMERRALYDEDGTIDEDDDAVFTRDRNWTDYWRVLFKKVTVDDIESFEAEYKGSTDEEAALKAAYANCKGDMDLIMDEVMCATLEDEPRFRALLERWISAGSLPALEAFTQEKEGKRKRRRKKMEKEAEQAKQEMTKMSSSDDSLSALIKAKQKSRQDNMDSFFDSLEERYAKKDKASKPSSSKAGKKRKK